MIESSNPGERRTGCALAIETSCRIGCVALGSGGALLCERYLCQAQRHAQDLLPAIAAVCRENGVAPGDITEVYVSVGPGSFTGLRIGVATARILAMGGGVKLVPVPTLEVIAQNALDAPKPPDRVAVILDAKRGRVYGACFERREDAYVAVTEPAECDPATLLSRLAPTDGVFGEGIDRHREVVEASGLDVLPESLAQPRGSTVLALGFAIAQAGGYVSPRNLVPLYIRPPEAEEKWAQRHGRSAGC